MIDEDTPSTFLDEWAERTLQSDMAKLVLQGGYMVSAVKHRKPKILDNRCPFYITTNEVPYFENDEENMQRTIVGNDVAVTERGSFTGVDLANAAESVIFDIDKVKSISKEETFQFLKLRIKLRCHRIYFTTLSEMQQKCS